MAPPSNFIIQYVFQFENGEKSTFKAELEQPGLTLKVPPLENPPAWTELTCHQCPNCPLSSQDHTYCPVALNLVEVIEKFKGFASFEKAQIHVKTPDREYTKKAALQEGIGSLIGLYMVTSGCPIMDKLRPMAQTHLPFASMEETVYRAVTMYLLAQYFLKKKGKEADWELNDLAKIYEDIKVVNRSFTTRILSIHQKDANLNALVRLDCYAISIHSSIVKDSLGKLEKLFGAYLKD